MSMYTLNTSFGIFLNILFVTVATEQQYLALGTWMNVALAVKVTSFVILLYFYRLMAAWQAMRSVLSQACLSSVQHTQMKSQI